MTDIFARLAARATGQSATGQGSTRAQPRTVPFESGAPTAFSDSWESGAGTEPSALAPDPRPEEQPTGSPAVDDEGPPRPVPGTGAPPGSTRAAPVGADDARRPAVRVERSDVLDGRGSTSAAEDQVAVLVRLVRPAVDAQQPPAGSDSGPQRPRPALGGAPRRSFEVPDSAAPGTDPGPVTDPGPARAARRAAGRPVRAPARQPPVVDAPEPPTISRTDAGDPQRRPTATQTSPPGRGPGPVPRAEAPVQRTSQAPTAAAEPDARPVSQGVMTPETFLRDHLGPALAHLGAIGERDRHALVPMPTAAPAAPIRDGAVAVGVDPVEVPAGGEVHVHIGRVEVTRAQPGPAPAAPRSPRPTPDHAAYLARQQDRWRR